MASPDALNGYDFDPRTVQFQYNSRLSWPLQQSHEPHPGQTFKRSTSPLPLQTSTQSYQQTATHQAPAALMREWHMTSQGPTTSYALDTAPFPTQAYEPYGVSFQNSPVDYLAPHPSLDVSMEANLGAGLNMDGTYLDLQGNINQMNPMSFNWQEMSDLMGYQHHALPDMNATQQVFSVGSPSDAYLSDTQLELRSLSSSDNGWTRVDHMHHQIGAISNPEQTLHPRTFSDSSHSDAEQQLSRNSFEFIDNVPPFMSSPGTDSIGDDEFYAHQGYYENQPPSPPAVVTTSLVQPIAIRQPTSPTRPPTSPTARRQSRKNPAAKSSKAVARRSSQVTKNETEKRVGRRKGPLRPEQRKQACEIRKLGACLRCKFLKKTCDTGEPCAGCQPSHARLWVVPCTRIDIKDIGYFMKDWKADYERHVSLGFSVGNIKGFSDHERLLLITHGYGHVLPIKAREVYVRDERVFGMNWVESGSTNPDEFEVNTAKLSAGSEGISPALLSDYVDSHIDGGFEVFVNDYFEGTPFITQILKTAYRYWAREKTPVIRKALKLVLAYVLTQHVTMVMGVPDEEGFEGKINDGKSKYRGQTIAPVMVNFEVKCAMADMWRELQKEILEELSSLYSSVYGKDKLKNWPTIFLLASILLAVWEMMLFDCHYRVPDAAVVSKFCNDMETTPVGVIVGLFQAISQKLPAFSEWDSRKHYMLLNNNPAVMIAMEEVKDHVIRHDKYLRSRSQATFDRNDFDSLSSKLVSKLVIRAN